ncbi:MAG TPA: hypothetical protein VMS31_08980 [Pyrinomonadaceae bacterium]|nr:hypothetical protein [Pyrinomonadaceae bacterium]
METNSWPGTLTALALLVACVLGCNKSGGDAPKPLTSTNQNSGNTSHTAPTTTPDIAGSYRVEGTNENGSPYRGELAVIKRGDVYQFRWNAGTQYDGVGVPNGNVVAVAFTPGSEGKGCGVVNYELVGDDTLDGKWGYWGVNESGTEKAVRTGGSGLPGNYDATGKNPDGSGYKATLAVAPLGGGYKFDWSNSASGFGVKQGTNVSVGIGGARCAFVAYQVQPDGNLEGIWGGYGGTKTGTEKATKK